MDPTAFLNQKQRLWALVVNAILLCVVYIFFEGLKLPSGGLKDLWFFSILGYWVFVLIGSPFFLPPKDSFGSALAAALMLATVDITSISILQNELNILRWGFVGLATLTVILAIFAIWFKDVEEKENSTVYKIGKVFYYLCSNFGKSEIVMTAPVMISILGGYQGDQAKLLMLIILWFIVVFLKPVELVFKSYLILSNLVLLSEKHERAGSVVRIDDPSILRVSLLPQNKWKAGNLHIARMHGGEQAYVLPLFSHLQDKSRIGTGILAYAPTTLLAGIDEETCGVYEAIDPVIYDEVLRHISGRTNNIDLVGFVVEGSTISTLRLEVSKDIALEEGMLIFVKVDNKEIYYQILDAETHEENFNQNPKGAHIVKAAQLGVLEADEFIKFGWLPTMNQPVFRISANEIRTVGTGTIEVGKIPSSGITVKADLNELIEYHAAILGVTGTGKTHLTFDIIRKSLDANVKVICVDITGEYRRKLTGISHQILSVPNTNYAQLEALLESIDIEAGFPQKAALKTQLKTLIEVTLKPAVKANLAAFMASTDNLAYIELRDIANSKGMLAITEIYLSEIMDMAKTRWLAATQPTLRSLIVLEEAHTIIPETFGSSYDAFTKLIVDRIGQIALQGRKYGVGLLIVSQRTALVSKTILSQCNSYFTFSLVDQTSLGYLANVYSTEHMKVIPNLRKYELLAFGKAIPSERPMLLKRRYIP